MAVPREGATRTRYDEVSQPKLIARRCGTRIVDATRVDQGDAGLGIVEDGGKIGLTEVKGEEMEVQAKIAALLPCRLVFFLVLLPLSGNFWGDGQVFWHFWWCCSVRFLLRRSPLCAVACSKEAQDP